MRDQNYPILNLCDPTGSRGAHSHVGDAITHKFLDVEAKKIIYRNAVHPTDSVHPNKRLVPDGGEISKISKPVVSLHSRQDESQSVISLAEHFFYSKMRKGSI